MADKKTPHPNSLANLKAPWKKGESGNPKGIQGDRSIRTVLKDLLDTPPTMFEKGKLPPFIRYMMENALDRQLTRQEVMALMVFRKAMDGDLAAFNTIVDRVEGRPVQKTENKNLNVNYVEFLKHKKAELEGASNEDQAEASEIFKGQDVNNGDGL